MPISKSTTHDQLPSRHQTPSHTLPKTTSIDAYTRDNSPEHPHSSRGNVSDIGGSAAPSLLWREAAVRALPMSVLNLTSCYTYAQLVTIGSSADSSILATYMILGLSVSGSLMIALSQCPRC